MVMKAAPDPIDAAADVVNPNLSHIRQLLFLNPIIDCRPK